MECRHRMGSSPGAPALRNPIIGTDGCCARAASGHAAAEQRDELAPFQWQMSPVLRTGRITHLGGAPEGRCTAGFQGSLCPLWVMSARCDPSVATAHVRFAPKSGQTGRRLGMFALCHQRSFRVATTGKLMIALKPGRLRHRICAGSTASSSFGQRVYKASSAHLPSSRAS
jgi:hypothetical protein